MTTITPTRQDAEAAAHDLLKGAWADDLSRCELPIDPFRIAATLGLKVIRIPLEPDVSGMLAKRPGQDPEVYINVTDSDVGSVFLARMRSGITSSADLPDRMTTNGAI